MEVGFDAPNLLDHRSRLLRESMRHRGGKQFAARANEEFGLQVFSKILQLQTDCRRRQVHALGSARDAAGLKDRQKYLKLMDVHAAPELTK
jgi:hypothetical protein